MAWLSSRRLFVYAESFFCQFIWENILSFALMTSFSPKYDGDDDFAGQK